jgi:hypothetical protein
MRLHKRQQYLLKILYDQFIRYELNKTGEVVAMDFASVCTAMDCNKEDLHFITAIPFQFKEIAYYNVKNIEGLYIQPAGIAAHSSKKYLKERRTQNYKSNKRLPEYYCFYDSNFNGSYHNYNFNHKSLQKSKRNS